MAETLYHVFYCSTLAPGESPGAVSAILSQARRGNAERGITGLLVFDGQHFLQYLEGPHAQVRQLMGRIVADPRHTGVHLVCEGPLAQRRCQRYEMGYADPAESEELDGLRVREGEAGLQRFLALRPTFDMED